MLTRLLAAILSLSYAGAFVHAASVPQVIPIWSDGAPGSADRRDRPEVTVLSPDKTYQRVSSIHTPSITVYPAAADRANGTAVLILPGGGFQFLSIDLEGSEVAAWFNRQGITAFVVKYRLPNEPDSTYTMGDALADAQRAIRLVRSRAAEWGVRPDRIGTVGFSAGGRIAADAGLRFQAGQPTATRELQRVSSRPDFQILVYGFTAPDAIPANTPPTFLVCAHNDGDKPRQAVALYSALLTNKVPAELHIYSLGGHAYAMREFGHPINTWNQRLRDWLQTMGLVSHPRS